MKLTDFITIILWIILGIVLVLMRIFSDHMVLIACIGGAIQISIVIGIFIYPIIRDFLSRTNKRRIKEKREITWLK